MNFAAEYLAQLETFAALGPLPRVRALHLPPPPADDADRGEFCAIELDDGSIGLSYVRLDDAQEKMRRAAGRLQLRGADALELARGYRDGGGIGKTLGFAAANALTRCLLDRAGFVPPDAGDSIGNLDPQPGEKIGMIGLFRPLVRRILDCGARLVVVELRPEVAGTQDGFAVTLDAAALADCTKIISTSTLLINDTLERMLAASRGARWFAMVGPGAGCLPDALFARGVTLLGGSRVVDRTSFVDALLRGEATSAFTRKFALTPDVWPGIGTLLGRIKAGTASPPRSR